MEVMQEPSVLHRFLLMLKQPFSRIKERWLSYFSHLALDDEPSATDSLAQNDSNIQDIDSNANDQIKRKSSLQNETFPKESSILEDGISEEKQESSEGNISKDEKATEEEIHQPIKNPRKSSEIDTKVVETKVLPVGNTKMKYKYTLCAMGATIGLSHLWRLPNMAFKFGSGNFIIIYSVLIILFGYPLYFLSLTTGQYASQTALKIFERVPLMQGIGISMVLLSYITAVYQTQMIGLGIHYFASSFDMALPWTKCDLGMNGTFGSYCLQSWSNEILAKNLGKCLYGNLLPDWDRLCTTNDSEYKRHFFEECCTSSRITAYAKEYFDCTRMYEDQCKNLVPTALHYWNQTIVRPASLNHQTRGIISEMNLKLLLCSLAASILVYVIALLGFKRTGYISMFVIPLIFAFFLLLAVSTIRMSTSLNGLSKLIKFDFNLLADSNIWFAAVEQCLYSLGLGMGLAISIGSICPFDNASHKTSLAVTFSVLGANILSTTLMYAQSGTALSDLYRPLYSAADAGIGSAFIVYSQALSQLPVSWLFSCIFYALFTVTAACSVGGLLYTVSVSIADVVKLAVRDLYVINFIVIFSCFLLGIPVMMREGVFFIEALDSIAAAFSIPIIVTLEIITLFIYGLKNVCQDFSFMLGFNCFQFLFPVCLIFPFGVAIVLIYKIFKYTVPVWNIWAYVTGYGALGLILIPFLLIFILRLFTPPGRSKASTFLSKVEQKEIEGKEFEKDKAEV